MASKPQIRQQRLFTIFRFAPKKISIVKPNTSTCVFAICQIDKPFDFLYTLAVLDSNPNYSQGDNYAGINSFKLPYPSGT